jgi:Protein of unknown function (DUF4242)
MLETIFNGRRNIMQTYVIHRRRAWQSSADLAVAAERSAAAGDEMSDDIRWLRSYVIAEPDGSVGTVCVYQASSPEAIREHAGRVGMPADEICSVVDTVIVRADEEPDAG